MITKLLCLMGIHKNTYKAHHTIERVTLWPDGEERYQTSEKCLHCQNCDRPISKEWHAMLMDGVRIDRRKTREFQQ